MQEEWNEFKNWVIEYERQHVQPSDFNSEKNRYCVAISCQDLVEKMEEIEEKYGRIEDSKNRKKCGQKWA